MSFQARLELMTAWLQSVSTTSNIGILNLLFEEPQWLIEVEHKGMVPVLIRTDANYFFLVPVTQDGRYISS